MYNLLSYNNISPKRKIAFVTVTPDQVVASTQYSLLANNILGYYKVCTTIEYAINWFNIKGEESIELIKNICDNPSLSLSKTC